jgi:S-adenosylmethionine hydrolase
MKGAALAVGPELRLVDICHEVPKQRVDTGSFILETGYAAFPAGTVHVAVVDPGVGTARAALALRAGEHFFVAPDNGLLTRVLEREPLADARLIQPPESERSSISATFEGRDLFAPAAARIALGLALDELGPPVGETVKLPLSRPLLTQGSPAKLPVLHVDDFGNVILDLHRGPLLSVLGREHPVAGSLALETESGMVEEFHRTYAEAEPGKPFMLINSAGYLEVAVKDGSAAALLDLETGMEAILRIRA